MQDQGDGLQPLAFMSRVLKPLQRHYSVYKCKLTAMAYCFLLWRTLFGELSGQSDSDDGPPTLDAHNAIGHLFLGLHEVGST